MSGLLSSYLPHNRHMDERSVFLFKPLENRIEIIKYNMRQTFSYITLNKRVSLNMQSLNVRVNLDKSTIFIQIYLRDYFGKWISTLLIFYVGFKLLFYLRVGYNSLNFIIASGGNWSLRILNAWGHRTWDGYRSEMKSDDKRRIR